MKKSILCLFVVTSTLFSCTKKAEIDPREQYLGTYPVTAISILKNLNTGQTSNGTSNYSVQVNKGSAADELTFDDGDRFTVKLSGSSFTIVQYNTAVPIGGTNYSFTVNGSGSFNSKNLSYIETQKTSIQGVSLQITNSISGNKP